METLTHKRAVLEEHCAEIGRDPSEIMISTHLRIPDEGGLPALVDEAAALAEAGLDLGIVYLSPPHSPTILEPLAEALGPLT